MLSQRETAAESPLPGKIKIIAEHHVSPIAIESMRVLVSIIE
jgi:hypothetical protein